MPNNAAVGSLQAGPTATRPTYRLIQLLRAAAALMVVAHHATIMLWERVHLPVPNWLEGSSGVDIFFVISGFVMTISSAPLVGTQHPARTFLARRLERIIPMYWIVTGVKVLTLLAVPTLGLNGLGGWRHVLASFAFIPSLSAEGRFEPVVVVGWTLNFEMAFYLLYALALGLRRRPLLWLTPLLLAVPLLPSRWFFYLPTPLAFFYSTQLWEFVMGMVLGAAVQRVRRVPWVLGLLAFVAGILPLLLWRDPGVDFWRGWQWGLPAMAVVFGAISMESRWGQRSPRWALEMGDASYSIYLVHTFTLPAIGLLLARLRWHFVAEIPVGIAVAIVLSALAGDAVYRGVEWPITRWFRGRRRAAIPVIA